MSTVILKPVWTGGRKKTSIRIVMDKIIQIDFYNDGHTSCMEIPCTRPDHAQILAAHLYNSSLHPETYQHFANIEKDGEAEKKIKVRTEAERPREQYDTLREILEDAEGHVTIRTDDPQLFVKRFAEVNPHYKIELEKTKANGNKYRVFTVNNLHQPDPRTK